MRRALDHLNQAWGRDNTAWGRDNTSHAYIAATVPGWEYTGQLYSKGGPHFSMKTHDNKLAIGHTVDLPAKAVGGDTIQFTATDGLSQQLKQPGSGPARGLAIE